jgi:hypothetical protein
MVGLALWLHLRFRAWVGESAAFLGAFVGTVAYPTMFGAQAAMSETWTCFLMAAALLLAVQEPRREGRARVLLAGLAAVWATLARMVPLAALAPVFVARGLWPWRRRRWRWVLLTAGVAALAPVALLVHNGVRSGEWRLSTKVGWHLYNHFVFEQKLLDPTGTATQELQAWIGPRDLRELHHWDATALMPAADAAQFRRREQLLGLVAWEAAWTVGLLDHLRFTSGLTWRNLSKPAAPTMVVGDWGGGLQPSLVHEAPRPAPLRSPVQRHRSAELEARIWPVLSWLFVLALPAAWLLRAGRFPWLCWLWTVWAYMFASSAIEYELPRYHVAVAPFVAMLGVGTAGLVLQRLAELLRRAAPAPSVVAPAP